MRWTKEELDKAILLIIQGKNFREVGVSLNRSQNSVTRKLIRMGYYSKYNKCGKSSKYATYDWILIQKKHDEGLTHGEILKEFRINSHAIIWAKENGKLIYRTPSEGSKLAWAKGNYKSSNKGGLDRYRQLCKFRFALNDYPDEFNFGLIEEYGWYQAKNNGDNPNGVSRDHRYSISEGFKNRIDPYYISHPANCKLMRHHDNNKKDRECSITLEELIKAIEEWDVKYGKVCEWLAVDWQNLLG